MSEETLAFEEVLDLLASDAWRVVGLPTMRGRGLYLVHDEGRFVWFSLDNRGVSASRYQAMDRARALAFLAKYARGDGYPRALVKPWRDDETPSPSALRAALRRTRALLEQLRAEPRAYARVMRRWWMWRSPWFGWVACVLPDERPPSSFAPDESRAASELLSMALAEPDFGLETPPPRAAEYIEDLRRRADAMFETHGPTRARLLWTERDGDTRECVGRSPRGHYFEADLRGEEGALELVRYRKLTEASAHEGLLTAFTRGTLNAGSAAIDDALARALARVEDPEALAELLAARQITVRCGEFRRASWVADTPTTLLDTYKGERVGLAEGLAPFLGDHGWYELRFERFVPFSELARADDDPQAPSVRYTIPRGWAYRFSRERLIERALEAVLRAATGHALPLPRVETRDPVDRESRRAPGRHVTIGDEQLGLTLDLDPIESGHGVHGERVAVRFHGLPPTIGIKARGRLDMRAGGQLQLDFTAAPERARELKRACLDALP